MIALYFVLDECMILALNRRRRRKNGVSSLISNSLHPSCATSGADVDGADLVYAPQRPIAIVCSVFVSENVAPLKA